MPDPSRGFAYLRANDPAGARRAMREFTSSADPVIQAEAHVLEGDAWAWEGRFDDARSLAVTHPGLRTAGGTMHAAIDADRADVVAFLLDLGMPLEVENEHRQRPLHLAAWKDAVDVGALLASIFTLMAVFI